MNKKINKSILNCFSLLLCGGANEYFKLFLDNISKNSLLIGSGQDDVKITSILNTKKKSDTTERIDTKVSKTPF